MARPQPEDERLRGRSIEEKLSEKFDFLQLSREERQPDLFDELVRSIEVLFKAVPDAYNDFIKQKETMDNELEEELVSVEQEALRSNDKISEDTLRSDKSYVARWEYREVLEEIIMELMQKHGLVIIQQKIYGEIEPVVEVETVEEPIEELPEPIPELQKKKPHLMKRRTGV